MSEILRPCPFCGESVELDYSELPNRKHWFITCECCGMMYQSSISQRKYVKVDWNNRHIEDALNARIAELEAAQKEALSLLPELERGHYYCDDCWYSCPKAVDGCCDESRGDECDCGADDYNALLAKIIGLLTPEVQE